jgi:hypothetical protein
MAKFQIPFNSNTRRCKIFLVFISSNFDEEGNKFYLTLKDTSLGKPKVISLTQLSIVEGTWHGQMRKQRD